MTSELELQIILDNKNLIYSIANIYKGLANIDDLFQAGCIGIIKAYKKYNPNQGTKFTSFAYSYILGEISNCVRENSPINISRELSSLSRKLERNKSYLTQEFGRVPTNEEVASYSGVTIQEYALAVNSTNCVESLDMSFTDDESLNMYDIIGNSLDIDMMIELEQALDSLEPNERKIILAQYIYDLNQTEIAKMMGMNQVAVSRTKTKIINKLRNQMK